MAELVEVRHSLEPWTRRRRRVHHLLERAPTTRQILVLCGALLDVQERAFVMTRDDEPAPSAIAAYVADRVMADVVDATEEAGPVSLALAARERYQDGALSAMVQGWLVGEEQPPVDRYLARAAAAPVLEALGSLAWPAPPEAMTAGHCPRCGGRPQVSYLPESGEVLVTASRMLSCSRCDESWTHARMTCPACGEADSARMPIYADPEWLPHLRADACETCRRYLITVDLRKEPEAVPVVDELAALPLDLFAQARGFTKIVPNLMGIG